MRLVIVSLLLAFLLPAGAASGETVCAEWGMAGGGTYFYVGYASGLGWRSQTFLAEVGGRPVSASFRLRPSPEAQDAHVPVRVAFFAVDGAGLPLEPALYEEEFAFDGYTGPGWQEFTFEFSAATPLLSQGESYAVAVSPKPGSGFQAPLWVNGGREDLTVPYDDGYSSWTYYDGSEWFGTTEFDMAFRIDVSNAVSTEIASFGSLKGEWNP